MFEQYVLAAFGIDVANESMRHASLIQSIRADQEENSTTAKK